MGRPSWLQNNPIYLYEENQEFVLLGSLNAQSTFEIMQNISIKLMLPPSLKGVAKIFYQIRLVTMSGFLLIITPLFAVMSFTALYTIFTVGTQGLFCLLPLLILCLVFLFVCIKESFLIFRLLYFSFRPSLKNTEKIYDDLIHRGLLLTGKVSKIKLVSMEDYLSGNKIAYRFTNSQGRQLTCSYVTLSDKSLLLKPGDQVAVLYLNPQVHILI